MPQSTILFSIVIPVYNRATELLRAVDSVAAQRFSDYETIVVDDGSTDRLEERIRDKPVRLVRHLTNRGVCPARNSGVDAARGEWVIFLDSDDELLPDALRLLSQRLSTLPPGVDRVAAMYRWDDGGTSPERMPGGEVLDYEGYIRWSAEGGRSDFLNCIRRSTFQRVRYPDGRAYERLFHLDFARHFHTWMVAEVVGLEHQDAPDNIHNLGARERVGRLLRDAPDGFQSVAQVLSIHGGALRRLTPEVWQALHKEQVRQASLAGQRVSAIREVLKYWNLFGWNARQTAVVALGVIGPRALAWFLVLWHARHGHE